MKLVWASDQSLLVREVAALPLFHALQAGLAQGVTGLSPAKSSMLIRFDARVTTHEVLEEWIRSVNPLSAAYQPSLVEIPVRYERAPRRWGYRHW